MKQKLVFGLFIAIGIAIGSAVNYFIPTTVSAFNEYIGLVEKLRFRTDSQQPVVKAIRIGGYQTKHDHVLIQFEIIKLRDCGRPIIFTISGLDQYKRRTTIAATFVDDAGNPSDSLNLVPDPVNWQKQNWVRLPLEFQNKIFFIELQYACPVLFLNEQPEAAMRRQATDDYSTAIDVVNKSYGPFQLKTIEEISNLSLDKSRR